MLFYLFFISNAKYLPFESKFSRLSSVYTSLKYKYLCNLVPLLPAEAIPPPKTVQIPAHAPAYLWCSQNGDSKHLWSAELEPFFTDDGSLQKNRNPRKQKIFKICRLVMWKLKRQQSMMCCAVEVVSGILTLCTERCSFSLPIPACTTGPPGSQQMWPLLWLSGFTLCHLWPMSHRS